MQKCWASPHFFICFQEMGRFIGKCKYKYKFCIWSKSRVCTILTCLKCQYLSVLRASWRTFQSSSLAVGCLLFCSLSGWSHTASVCLGPSSGEDSCLHKTCCHWFSVQFLCNLSYLSFFSLFPLFKNDFFSWRLFLMRLQWTVDGSTEGPDASLSSCVGFYFLPFLKDITFRYCSSDLHSFPATSFPLHLSRFLIFL